jgi:hypothetical protein
MKVSIILIIAKAIVLAQVAFENDIPQGIEGRARPKLVVTTTTSATTSDPTTATSDPNLTTGCDNIVIAFASKGSK